MNDVFKNCLCLFRYFSIHDVTLTIQNESFFAAITSSPKYSRLTAASTVILVEANALVLDESGISALFVNGVFGAGVGCITESHFVENLLVF